MLSALVNDPEFAWIRIALGFALLLLAAMLFALGTYLWANADEEHDQVRTPQGTVLGAVAVSVQPNPVPHIDRAIEQWRER